MANIHDVDIEQEETHKKSIVKYIERHVESLSAVLILAVENAIDRMEYTYSTWSAILPKTLGNNIAFIFPSFIGRAFIFPSVLGRLAWSFFKAIPTSLERSPVFTVDCPIVPLGNDITIIKKNREPTALKSLVALFDWLDDLEPQPAKEIVSLYQKYQSIGAKTFAILHQRAQEVEIDRLMTKLKKHSAVSLSPCLHLAFESYVRWR